LDLQLCQANHDAQVVAASQRPSTYQPISSRAHSRPKDMALEMQRELAHLMTPAPSSKLHLHHSTTTTKAPFSKLKYPYRIIFTYQQTSSQLQLINYIPKNLDQNVNLEHPRPLSVKLLAGSAPHLSLNPYPPPRTHNLGLSGNNTLPNHRAHLYSFQTVSIRRTDRSGTKYYHQYLS